MPENFEPERYELTEPPAYEFAPTRREFAIVLGAGILVTVTGSANGAPDPGSIGARLHLGDDGTVTVLSGKVEGGQGSRTEIAMAAAEELNLPPDRIRVLLADTDLVPNDGITAGSRTTPATIPAVRKACAAARPLIAQREGGKPPDLARVTLPASVDVKAVNEWRVLGVSQPQANARAIVTGAHRYPSDIVRPGMLYGSVLRAPSYGAKLREVDLAAARSMPGVTAVRDGEFAGCAASTSMAARKAVEAIAASAQWDRKEHPASTQLFEHLKRTAPAAEAAGRKPRVQSKGDIERALVSSKKRLRAEFRVPYIQHAPMEPRAAVAEWDNGRLTVWTGTQNPFGVRDQLAQAFKINAAQIRVVVPDMGGGFGGKHSGECAIEAARLAREARKPVSLLWTRAEEFAWAYFRPAGLFEIEAGLGDGGLLTAWDFNNYNAGAAAIESPYRIEHTRTRFLYCDSPLREGSYRGIAATANNFARESFMDELAGLAGMDPFAFRMANLENSRLRDVVAAAAKRFDWENRRKQKRTQSGIGLACGTEKGSYVAACAEVETGKPGFPPRIRQFTMAFECGAILNPSNLRAQVEGSIVQGLGGALMEAIEFADGRLKNGSFAKYPVPRFRDVPPIDIVLLDRKDLAPAGAGETPIIAVAPAIANAVFDAASSRVRSLPVRLPS